MKDSLLPSFRVERKDRELLLGQKGVVVWLYGLSGAGKSTLANEIGMALHQSGRLAMHLDGDVLRNGLNHGLGFTAADREENLRRAAEVAKLALQSGAVILCSFITPQNSMRSRVREIVGEDDLVEVYVKCSFETCAARDVKGLYAKAGANQVRNFTGKDSAFEEPDQPPALVVDTDATDQQSCAHAILELVRQRISPSR